MREQDIVFGLKERTQDVLEKRNVGSNVAYGFPFKMRLFISSPTTLR